MYKGNAPAKAFAEKIKNIKIIEFDSIKALLEAVTTGEVDVMLGNAAMFYLLNKTGNPFLPSNTMVG